MPVSQPVRLTAWFIIQTKTLLRIKKSEISRADPLHKLLLPQAKQGFCLPPYQTVPAPLPSLPNSSGSPPLPNSSGSPPLPTKQLHQSAYPQCSLPYFLNSFRCCSILPMDMLSLYTKCSPPPPWFILCLSCICSPVHCAASNSWCPFRMIMKRLCAR